MRRVPLVESERAVEPFAIIRFSFPFLCLEIFSTLMFGGDGETYTIARSNTILLLRPTEKP
jgi:hypothetical protein